MSWESWEQTAERGPGALLFRGGLWLFVAVMFIGLLLWIGGCFREAADVAREQFGPRALLEKYELFKSRAAALDSKLASIEVQESVCKSMEANRDKWDRTDKETYYQRQAELAGMKTSYNQLAATYNADMAKENYRFANAGELPKGADKPLPREYRVYITK